MFKRVLHTKSIALSAVYDASKILGNTSDYGASVPPEFLKSQHIAFGASPADFMERTAVTLLQNWEKFCSLWRYREQDYHIYFHKYWVFHISANNRKHSEDR